MTKTITSLAFVVAAIALFFVYTKPEYDGLKAQQAEIARYNLALDKAAELQRLKQQLLARYNSFNPADIDRLHKLLPDHVDNVRLVLDLDTLASKHGLALQNISISAPTQSSVTAGELTIGPALATFDSLTMSFKTTGPYDRFVGFLTELEESLRIVDVEKLSLTSSSGAGATSYAFDIALRTYWLK